MRCPSCDTEIAADHPLVAHLCICPNGLCARTLAVMGENARLAVSADTISLSDGQLAALRAQRKKVRA